MSIEKLKEARPYVIVGAFVVAAVVTPPDVLSQFMLAVPMCLLYEAGLFLVALRRHTAQAGVGIQDPALNGVVANQGLEPRTNGL